MKPNTLKAFSILLLTVLIFFAGASPAASAAQVDAFFHSTITLPPGDTQLLTYPVLSGSRATNMKISVSGTGGWVGVAFSDGSGGPTEAFTKNVYAGETVWAPTTLTKGNNVFTLKGNSGAPLTVDIWLYDSTSPDYTWTGVSLRDGTWNSSVKLNFPTSGLYDFKFTGTAGAYQFIITDAGIQKTVQVDQDERFYVPSGVHEMKIVQSKSTIANPITWTVAISSTTQTADTLPLTKTGSNAANSDLRTELLPLRLNAAAPVELNFHLKLTAGTNDMLTVKLGDDPTGVTAKGGEDLWWSSIVQPGTTNIRLDTSPTNVLVSYELTIDRVPVVAANAPVAVSGISQGMGVKSSLWFTIPQGKAGLYEFSYNLTTPLYQFFVLSRDASPATLIQKTNSGIGTDRYYLDAGTYTLQITQNTYIASTGWSVQIAATDQTADTLTTNPTTTYTKTGKSLLGVFGTERLPLNLKAATTANMKFTPTGNVEDWVEVSFFNPDGQQNGATLKVYTGETVWMPFNFPAGTSQMKVTVFGGNREPLDYSLELTSLPTSLPVSPVTFSGVARGIERVNSQVQFIIPTDGDYQVNVTNTSGFSQAVIDEVEAPKPTGAQLTSPLHEADYTVHLTKGVHTARIKQSVAPLTEWTVNVVPTVKTMEMAHFSGVLPTNPAVSPLFPWFSTTPVDVNFKLSVTGGNPGDGLAVDIKDSTGTTLLPRPAEIKSGETLWGTVTLKPGQNSFTFISQSGSPLNYDLVVYAIPSADGSTWSGLSQAPSIWQSNMRMYFPESGLYQFKYGAAAGRFQFQVENGSHNALKNTLSDGPVTFFVEKGLHTVTIQHDKATPGADWSLEISNAKKAGDVLPYTQSGVIVPGMANQFLEEDLPFKLSADQKINYKLDLVGTSNNFADVQILGGDDGSTVISTVTGLAGGESIWWTKDLTAGTHRLRVVAKGSNPGQLAYTFTAFPQPTLGKTTQSWTGKSYGISANNSLLRFTVPADGLYTLHTNLVSGRYQVQVDPTVDATTSKASAYLQKTIEQENTANYYLKAGDHYLRLVQDSTQPLTDWSVDLTASAPDMLTSLPYAGGQLGGNLNGQQNRFTSEWLPIHLDDAQVNFTMTLAGNTYDTFAVRLYAEGNATPVYETVIHGGETFWWPQQMPEGVSVMEIAAAGGNAAPLSYTLASQALPIVSTSGLTWQGVAFNRGNHSFIKVTVPVTGDYHIMLSTQGAANLTVTQVTPSQPALGPGLVVNPTNVMEFTAKLQKGEYVFEIAQSTADLYPQTTWTLTVSDQSKKLFLPGVFR